MRTILQIFNIFVKPYLRDMYYPKYKHLDNFEF